MSLLGKTQDMLASLIDLESKRIKDYNRTIKIYPEKNPASIKSQESKAQAESAKKRYEALLHALESLYHSCDKRVLAQFDEQFRQAIQTLNQCRNDRHKILSAEEMINAICAKI
ncbi:hypothetical protein JW756_01290 [Candidatus Woesearchaeota archaeon]|nr:hypothetical protein [Candidatus Woesearchaeota archaeon]